MRPSVPLTAALLAAALFFAAGLPALAQDEQRIVVLVNDDPISVYDIEQRARFLQMTQQGIENAQKAATDMLVEERLQMQEAKKLNFNVDESDIDRIVDGMAQRNNMDRNALAQALGQMGVNIKTMRDRIRAQLAWQGVVQRKFRHDVNIFDSDVDRALAGSGGETAQGTALQLHQVSFPLPANGGEKALAERLAAAESLRARFSSCANVPELAKGFTGATVKSMEDHKPDSLAQPARLLVSHAKVGQMTPPAITAAGVELYAVCGKRNVKGDPKEREVTQRKLMQEEYEIRAQRLLRDLRQDAFIEHR